MGVRVIGTLVRSHCTTHHFDPYLLPKTGGWKWPVPINQPVTSSPKAHLSIHLLCMLQQFFICLICVLEGGGLG